MPPRRSPGTPTTSRPQATLYTVPRLCGHDKKNLKKGELRLIYRCSIN